MSAADAKHFPAELSYLVPALEALAKIPDEDLNEDVDAIAIESALRERVKGMSLRDAVSCLTKDSKLLKSWLKEAKTENAAAVWVSGYLMRPGPLARALLAPSAPPDPVIEIDMPTDWKSRQAPLQLSVSKEKIVCTFILKDEAGYKLRFAKNEARERAQNDGTFAFPGKWAKSAARFGESRGYKYSYSQTAPAWKAVEYILEIKGGFVTVQLNHEKGKDFDESEIEARFHTLRVVPPR